MLVSAATYRSAKGMRAGVRPRLAGRSGPGRRARAAASARSSSAAASSSSGGSPPAARHDARHRHRQVTRALRVRAAEHRPPPRRVAAVFGSQDRQHPAARRQGLSEGGQRRKVRHRGPRDGQLAEWQRPRGSRSSAAAGARTRTGTRQPASDVRTADRPAGSTAPGRRRSGEASGRAGPAADGSRTAISPLTALRAASPAGPGSAASRSASSAAGQANGCGAGTGAGSRGAGGRSGSSPTPTAPGAPRSRG